MIMKKIQSNLNSSKSKLILWGLGFLLAIGNHLPINAQEATSQAATTSKEEPIYKYKDYDVIDLGSLEVKGEIMAPGDLTVAERDKKNFDRRLLEKNNFDLEIKREIENLR